MGLAKMQVTGMDEVIASIEAMGSASDKIFEEALRAGAAVLANEMRTRLDANIYSRKSVAKANGRALKVSKATGDLQESLGIAPVRINSNGEIDVKVGFSGYDRKHVANQLKARAMNKGTSRLIERPFARLAFDKTKAKIQRVIGDTLRFRLKQVQEG